MPKVSVLMPVRNMQEYICPAIESVLRQSYSDFELLIIDDGSTDRSVELIRKYRDERIRLMLEEHHFVENLNKGIREAKGKYIARMDADDIMHSERLRIQVQRMEELPDITVCASWMQCFGENYVSRLMKSFAGRVIDPLGALLENNMIFHPTVMMRKEFLEIHGLCYRDYARAEDYKLWADIACRGGQFYIEPQALLFYRRSSGQVSVQPGIRLGGMIRREIMDFLLDFTFKEEKESKDILQRILSDLRILEKKNLISEQYTIQFFKEIMRRNNP